MQTNIIFDFGGVLIQWDPHFIYQRYFNCIEKSAEFFEQTNILEINKGLDKGLSFSNELAKLAQKFPQYREAIFMWRDQWPEMIRGAISESVAILVKLHRAGYPLYGLTNWSAETFPFALENFKFLDYFQDIVVSGQVKTIKPEPKIFRLLLTRNNLCAEECIFIDDSLANVKAAETLGFKGIHFQNPEQLAEQLSKFKILI